MIEIYSKCPQGIYPGTSAEEQVKNIGQAIHNAGGKQLMLVAHQEFAARNYFMKRDLERVWDGIGDWRG